MGNIRERRQLDEPDGDTLRILVSTDNHLGSLEHDPVRGPDSFAAFEEVLYLAKKLKVGCRSVAIDASLDDCSRVPCA